MDSNSYVIKVTPELRIRIMHAETLSLDLTELLNDRVLEFVDSLKECGELSGSDIQWLNEYACEFSEELNKEKS